MKPSPPPQELLGSAAITADSSWEAARPLLELEPALAAVSEAERRAAFDAAVGERRRAAAATSGGDVQFRQLLAGLDPPIHPTSTWAGVKRRVRPRQTVPAQRCRGVSTEARTPRATC